MYVFLIFSFILKDSKRFDKKRFCIFNPTENLCQDVATECDFRSSQGNIFVDETIVPCSIIFEKISFAIRFNFESFDQMYILINYQ